MHRRLPGGPLQGALALAAALMMASCNGRFPEKPLSPPPTPPLSRSVIGFGVVNVSYTQVFPDPALGNALGYLRRGSLVRVLERRRGRSGEREPWVLVEGSYRGWLKEEAIRLYDNEAQAKTAAEAPIP